MPFPIWCVNCDVFIAKGSRFNATKQGTDYYYSTEILEFTFNCPNCGHALGIRTDPKNSSYVVAFGAKARTLEEEEPDTLALISDTERKKIATDPFKQLELGNAPIKSNSDNLSAIIKQQDERWKDCSSSSRVRSALREQRRAEKPALRSLFRMQRASGLETLSLPAKDHPDDIMVSKAVHFVPKGPAIEKRSAFDHSYSFSKHHGPLQPRDEENCA